jgi:adenylylsulfate kinase
MAYAQRGVTVWLTGLPCAGKSTIANDLVRQVRARGYRVELLDGDVVRTNLSKGLGFSRADRDVNVLRIGFVANLLSRNGVVVVVAAVSPYASTRARVRQQVDEFLEVYVACPIDVCERRDVKGMYKKARDGELPAFTGVDDPYEPPAEAEVTVDTSRESVATSVARVISALERRGYVSHLAEPVPALASKARSA